MNDLYVFPLPNRIPRPPSYHEDYLLKKVGVRLIDDGEDDSDYVRYVLPNGWSLRDYSEQDELPVFYIMDSQGLAHFKIHGIWGWDLRDSKLRLEALEQPTEIYFRPSLINS